MYVKIHLFLYLFLLLICFLLFLIPKRVSATPASDTMAGYWKLDESAAGSTVTDSSGDGNSGTPQGTGGGNNLPQPSTNVPATVFPDSHSLSFDGTDDYVDLGTTSGLRITTSLTISAWVKFNSDYTSTQTIMANTASSGSFGNYFLEFGRTDNKFTFIQGNSVDATSTNTISDNNWHHVAVTRSGSTGSWTIKFYIDGALDSTTVTTNDPGSFPENASIGRPGSFDGNYFKGQMDDVRIYSRVLSLTEAADLAAGKHTIANWTGSSSSNNETATNWDISAIPDPYTLWVIPNTATHPILTSNEASTGVTINSGAILDLAGFTISFNDGGAFTNNGSLYTNGPPPPGNSSSSSALAPASSGPVSCNDPAPVTTPDLFEIDPAGTFVNLYFVGLKNNVNGYHINYGLDSSANQYGDNYDSQDKDWVSSRTVYQLSPNTIYYFRMQGANGCNAGAWSQTVKVKTKGRLADIGGLINKLNPFAKKPTVPSASLAATGDISGCSYQVQSGDSLWTIALRKFGSGTKYPDLLALNPGLSSNIRAGQNLILCQ